MKIVILANDSSGLYGFRKELIEKLVEDNDIYICLPDGEFIVKLVDIGCEYIPCNFLESRGTNPFKDIRLILLYRKILKQIQPDIVFTYTIKPNVYGGMVCGILDIPYVANITGLGTAVENESFLQKITLILYKLGLRKAQKVFFQNSENRDFMLNHGVIKTKYDMLPGSGVNLSQYKLLEYPKNKNTEFVFVARVIKEKGIDQYLEAAQYICKKYSNISFHICGSCDDITYKEKLQELQELGVVYYHGDVNDMSKIYERVSCTIHPTYYPEGLSNVLLESCASGRPIITTNRSGCREVVDDKKNGFIVKMKDSQDLISKIEKFLELPISDREKMGIEGRKKVEREFDRKIVIGKYLEEVEVIKIKNAKTI